VKVVVKVLVRIETGETRERGARRGEWDKKDKGDRKGGEAGGQWYGPAFKRRRRKAVPRRRGLQRLSRCRGGQLCTPYLIIAVPTHECLEIRKQAFSHT
jgi:hypothetical protein